MTLGGKRAFDKRAVGDSLIKELLIKGEEIWYGFLELAVARNCYHSYARRKRREQLLKLKTSGTVVRAPTGPAAFRRRPSRTAGKHIPQIHSPPALRSPTRGAHWLNPRGKQRRKELSM